jgi:hypothetical protein
MSEEFKIKIASDFDARGAEQASDAMDAMADTSLPKIESPAKKAEQALHEVEKQAIDAATALRTPAAAADAMDEEIDQLTQRLIEAKIGTADFTAAQNDLAAALQRQFEAAQKVSPALEQKNAASKQVESTSRNTGMAMLEFSRAFEDAQYGIAGVLNNIPGLLGALGLGAGLAGVASVAAVVLAKTLGPAFEALDEKLELSSKASDKRKEKAAELNEELRKTTLRSEETNLSKYLDALDDAAEAHQAVNDRIQAEIEKQAELRQAREATVQSELQLRDALLRVQEGTGQVTPEEAAKQREILRKEMNEANLAASIAAVKEAEVKAAAEREAAEYQRWVAKAQQAALEQDLRRTENLYLERLDELNQRRSDQLKARVRAEEEAASEIARRTNAAGGLLGPIGTIAAGATSSMVVRPAETLQEDSAVAEAKANLEALESRMLKLNQKVDAMDGTIQSADRAVSAADEQLSRTQAIVAAKVDSLQSIATNNEVVEKAEGLQEKLEKNAQESAKAIEKAIEGVEPQNAKEKAALEELKTVLEDGKVLPEETQKVTRALNDLYALLNGNFQQIVQQLQVNAQTQSGILRSLQTLQSQALSDREKVNGLLRSQSR